MKTVKTLLDMGEEKNVMNTISRIEEQVIGKKKLYRNKGGLINMYVIFNIIKEKMILKSGDKK